MFGMGMTEILLIAIVAVIALGPEKLPDAMVKIAKMFNSVKRSLNDAKSTLDTELNISELKNEANKFKAQIEETKASLTSSTKIDLGLDDILNDDLESSKKEEIIEMAEIKDLKKEPKEIKKEKESKKKEENFSLKNSEEKA